MADKNPVNMAASAAYVGGPKVALTVAKTLAPGDYSDAEAVIGGSGKGAGLGITAGAAVGGLVGGPPGALAGAAIGGALGGGLGAGYGAYSHMEKNKK